MAGLYLEGEGSFEEVKAGIEQSLKEMKADPWCGICMSTKLTFEDAATKFNSIEEAKPFIAQNQIEQMLARVNLNHRQQN